LNWASFSQRGGGGVEEIWLVSRSRELNGKKERGLEWGVLKTQERDKDYGGASWGRQRPASADPFRDRLNTLVMTGFIQGKGSVRAGRVLSQGGIGGGWDRGGDLWVPVLERRRGDYILPRKKCMET